MDEDWHIHIDNEANCLGENFKLQVVETADVEEEETEIATGCCAPPGMGEGFLLVIEVLLQIIRDVTECLAGKNQQAKVVMTKHRI